MKKRKRIKASIIIALILNEIVCLLPFVQFDNRVDKLILFLIWFLSVNEIIKCQSDKHFYFLGVNIFYKKGQENEQFANYKH